MTLYCVGASRGHTHPHTHLRTRARATARAQQGGAGQWKPILRALFFTMVNLLTKTRAKAGSTR